MIKQYFSVVECERVCVNLPQCRASSSESSWQSSSPSHIQRCGIQWPVWHWKLLASHVWWPTREKQRQIKGLEKLARLIGASQMRALNSLNLKCQIQTAAQLVQVAVLWLCIHVKSLHKQIYIFTTVNIYSALDFYENRYINNYIVCVII